MDKGKKTGRIVGTLSFLAFIIRVLSPSSLTRSK